MPSTATSRLEGLTTSVAVKAPCRLATTSNDTLSGLAARNGTTPVEGDRVLVAANTDASENGIYNASSGAWTRAKDCDGSRDLVDGTIVYVRASGTFYQASVTDPVDIGTDDIAWANIGPTLATDGLGINILHLMPTANLGLAPVDDAFYDALAMVSANNEHSKPGGPTIIFPEGRYLQAAQWVVDKQVTLLGSSNGLAGAGQSVVIEAAEDEGGILFDTGSDGSVMIGLDFFGSGTDEGAHGITANVRIRTFHTSARSFPGHGFLNFGDGSTSTNANCTSVLGGHFEGNGLDGIRVEGGDSNVVIIQGADCRYNGNHGGYDQSFLGCLWSGCHFDQNGILGVSHNRTLPSMCTYPGGGAGDQYYVVPGQEALASTTTPGTNSAVWRRMINPNGVRGTVSTAAPLWVTGMTWRAGGAFAATSSGAGHTLFLGCYSEQSQPAAYLKTPAISIGGTHGAGVDRADGAFGGSHIAMVQGEIGSSSPIGFRSVTATSTRFSYIGGMDASLEGVWRFGDSVKAPQAFRWRFNGNNVLVDYASDPAKSPFSLIGPISTNVFGRAAAPVGRMVCQELFVGLLAGDKARAFHSFEGAPDNAVGGDGDFGWRHNAGSGDGFLYHKVAGAWVSVLTHP